MSMILQGLIRKMYKQLCSERGQGLSEYVLVIFLFAIAMMLSFSNFTVALQGLFATIQTAFS